MTPEQLDLVERVFGVALVLGTSPMGPDEFLRRFPADDGRAVTRMVLEEAVSREDKGLLETGLRMTHVFQSGKEVAEPLRVALLAPWNGVPHHVASVLGEVGDEESVDLLYGTAGSDFAFSGYRDMARFSVEALARIGTPEAVRALERLALSDDQSIMRAMTRYFHGYRWVRAAFDDEFIVLYTAVGEGESLEPGRREGFATWFTTSFHRLMSETAWGEYEGRERPVAVRVRRDVFEGALAESVMVPYVPIENLRYSAWVEDCRRLPVRFSWPCDLDRQGVPLPFRCLTLSMTGGSHEAFWDPAHPVEDLSELVRNVRRGTAVAPEGSQYPLPVELRDHVGASP